MATDASVAQVGSELEENTRLTVARLARHAAAVGIAGVVTGLLIGGVGGRLLMRVAALAAPDGAAGALTENGNRVGDITLGGTLGVVLGVGLFAGVMGAALYFISEPWLARFGSFRGPVFGLFLMLVASGQSNSIEPLNLDFALVGNQAFIVGMFVALFFLFGVLIAPLVTLADRRLPEVRPERPLRSAGGYIALSAFGFLVALVLVLSYLTEGKVETATGTRPDDRQVVVGGLLLATALVTLLVRLAPFYGGARPRRAAMVFGYVSLVGAAAVGGLQAARDIAEIV